MVGCGRRPIHWAWASGDGSAAFLQQKGALDGWCRSCNIFDRVIDVNVSIRSLHVREAADLDFLSDENAQIRRLRSLLSLFAMYAAALLFVTLASDGGDIGCILMGIAGHVVYAMFRISFSWRDAALFATARSRMRARVA